MGREGGPKYQVLSWHGYSKEEKKFIKGIKDTDGVWQTEEEVVSNIFVNFYTRLFSSTGPLELDRVLEGVNQIVNDDMNVELTKPYTQEEVDAAIKQMSLLKAPSPDGMPPLFY